MYGEREAVVAAGLGYERISFKVWHPEDEDFDPPFSHLERYLRSLDVAALSALPKP